MRKQQGFTLIELVIVIVILGILAVTAAPKFLDLSSDARESTVKGLEGALKGGINIVYSKSAIEGVEGDITDAGVDLNGDGTDDLDTRGGYPDSTGFADGQRELWIDLSATDWTISDATTRNTPITITPVNYTPPGSELCQVVYTPATAAGVAPGIVTKTDGC